MIEFRSTVRDLSHKGLGVIDHPDGRVFFARGVWPGDEGIFAVPAEALKYEEAILVRLESASPERVPVRCEFRGSEPGKCGGCPWMMGNYSSQLHYKTKRLLHALERRKIDLSATHVQDIIPSADIFSYRNRIQLKTNGREVGYVSEGTSILAPVSDCYILNPKLHSLFHQLRATLPREHWKPDGEHKWCFLDLDDDLEVQEVELNRRRPFKQGNTAQNEVMKKWVEEKFTALPSHWPVIDMFSGDGNFTSVLSRIGFSNILATEVQGSAIEKLRNKQLSGVRVLAVDLREKGSWAHVARHQPHAKAMLVDPPREGIDKRRGFFKYFDNLEYVFYVSCEVDTFSRDAHDFIRHGFDLIELIPLDLFPHTPHVEVMSVFRKKSVPKSR